MSELSLAVFGGAPQVVGGFDCRGTAAAVVLSRPPTTPDVTSSFCVADMEHQAEQVAALLQPLPQSDGVFQTALLPPGGHPAEPARSRPELVALFRAVPSRQGQHLGAGRVP